MEVTCAQLGMASAGATRMDIAGICKLAAGLGTSPADEHLHRGAESDL